MSSIADLIKYAEENGGFCTVGIQRTKEARPSFTAPEGFAFAASLPEPINPRADIPRGWGLFPPFKSPIVLKLVGGDRRSQDPEHQPIPKGAEGWLVCAWSITHRRGKTCVVRVGFNPIPPSLEHRWIDVYHHEIDRIPAIQGRPLDLPGWELRRLDPVDLSQTENTIDLSTLGVGDILRRGRLGAQAARLDREALDLEAAAAESDREAREAHEAERSTLLVWLGKLEADRKLIEERSGEILDYATETGRAFDPVAVAAGIDREIGEVRERLLELGGSLGGLVLRSVAVPAAVVEGNETEAETIARLRPAR